MSRSRKQVARQVTSDEAFDASKCMNPSAAGIDIGAEFHYVSVPPDRDEEPIRKFGCTTPDIIEMADWLLKCRITAVAMESTGVYWRTAHYVLTARGLDVVLVDARHASNVPGRKSDVQDCAWIRQLYSYGLLRGCFLPSLDVEILRSFVRQRGDWVTLSSQEILRIHKALEMMNLHIHKAISDITGVTGMSILTAINNGERNPHTLTRLRARGIKASDEEMVKALTGNYREDQLFALRQAVATYQYYQAQIRECDAQIEKCLDTFEKRATPPVTTCDTRPRSRRKNQSHFDLAGKLTTMCGVDLTTIDGISALTAQTVLSECGPDLALKFPTAGHYVSWLGLCPNNRVTGGRVRSSRTRNVHSRVATALRVAAQSLHRSQTAMGAYYRRLRYRIGSAKAITATAHKLARLVYALLTHGQAYVDTGVAEAEERYAKRQLKALAKRAGENGYALVNMATGERVS